ncbi:ATP-binding protein [Enterocloster sp.]|uniref:ATP-binding protein n=1 Tax=Enterocloster sp. TaxID=2719315 RepID=UPI003A95DBCB
MDSNITKAVIKAATAAKADKNAEDYYKDGVLVCGKCHTNKEKKIQLAGEYVTVRCICKCESEERERIQKQKDYEEEMRRIERLKVASLMDAKLKSATLKTFTQKEDNQKLYTIVKNYVDNFETFYKSNRGLLFWGTVGTGKSYAAACIANELLNRKTPVVMTSFVKVLQVIQDNTENETEFVNRLCAARLLIIDDLGTERNTDYALEKVYNVIDSRYRTGKPLILTTNLNLQDMQMTQDIRYQRIYDRIFEMCHPVMVNGTSWRINQAKERFNETKRLLES